MKKRPIRLAHISDLHFSRLSFSPFQFFSKRWLGNLNLLFNRGRFHLNKLPFKLIKKLKQYNLTDIIITGDLTTTSCRKEFQIAQRFIDALEQEIESVFLIPGNHDHYTRKSCRNKRFYQYFPPTFISPHDDFSLEEHGVALHALSDKWYMILLDTTKATSLPYSTGNFSVEIEENLIKLLKKIPKDIHILLTNHFPFFLNEHPKRRLKRAKALEKILRDHPNIKLYIHGHTHRHCLADLRVSGLPIILDSGSLSHKDLSSWNLIELTDNQITIDPYYFSPTQNTWEKNITFQCNL